MLYLGGFKWIKSNEGLSISRIPWGFKEEKN